MRLEGFAPFMDGNARILILGSFPSVKSRENDFYYGNPQNRFWKMLAKAFGETVPQANDEKKLLLLRHNVALWDMVTECEITGSLDSNIKDFKVANLDDVLSNAKIEKIILNGGKAADIFKKNYPTLIGIAVFLPSTSPANVRFDESIWLDELRK